MFGIPYKIMASILVGSAIVLAIIFAIGLPLNLVL